MKPITRAEVLQRAQQWVTEAVPYSQTQWWTDSLGTYRQDCSGYVSMAWGLDQNIDFWTGNLATVSHQITQAELKPGDILLNPAVHTLVFAGWADSSHSAFNMYEESHPGSTAHYVTGASYSDYASTGFSPYRFALIQDNGSAPSTTTPVIVPVSHAMLAASVPATLPPAPMIAWTDGGGTVAPRITTTAHGTSLPGHASLPSLPTASLASVNQVMGATQGSSKPVASPAETSSVHAASPAAGAGRAATVRQQAFSMPVITGWAALLLAVAALSVWLNSLRSAPTRGRHRASKRSGTRSSEMQ